VSFAPPSFMSFRDVVSRAAIVGHDRAGIEVHWSILENLASEGSREFARLSEVCRTQWKTPLVANQRWYRLPHDCLRINRVAFIEPGEDAETVCWPMNEDDILDGTSSETEGPLEHWYLSRDRLQMGLFPVPTTGGYIGTVITGSTDTALILDASASTEDDFYNDMTIVFRSGNKEGTEATITDYDGTTQTATVASISAAPDAGSRIEIYPDTLLVDYSRRGNEYIIKPTAGVVASSVVTPTVDTFGTASFDKPWMYYEGCEIFFTSGALDGFKTRVLESHGSGANHWFKVFPELVTAPSNTDTFEITQCPNCPEDYQHYISEYVIWQAYKRYAPAIATEARENFFRGVQEAKATFATPEQAQRYNRVRMDPRYTW